VRRKIDDYFPTETEELREVVDHIIILRVTTTVNDIPSLIIGIGEKFVVCGRVNDDIEVLCSRGVFRATNSAVHHYSRKIA
jgi:hypothetical protein